MEVHDLLLVGEISSNPGTLLEQEKNARALGRDFPLEHKQWMNKCGREEKVPSL